jgi:hypothetical protein
LTKIRLQSASAFLAFLVCDLPCHTEFACRLPDAVFHMRPAQSGGDSAHPVVARARLKQTDTAQRLRQIIHDLENNPTANDLVLVRYTMGKFEIRIVLQKFPLDVGDLHHVFSNPFQVRCVGAKRAPLTFVVSTFQNVFKYSISARLSVSGKSVPK